ncbi:serine protease filzig-like isoform X2 [Neocloeon triangulifer]|uniref:serine protease filzig-like isoform X2 n=1 Tax=Neocloeon triangulifer TaxID=2078957 RepID=UPI00286F5C7A|nr:serine protease filzig-like isoform X2 [Neocloeon triangulifer]XP_059475165.1 serine protease filzig-like isoform X2 [Neocloeon triangulifer]
MMPPSIRQMPTLRASLAQVLLAMLLVPSVHSFSPRFNFNSNSRKLFGGYRIVPSPCKSETDGRQGICMFNYECAQRQGDVIGACMDGFLFGACCQLPPGASYPGDTSSLPVKPAFENPSTVETDVFSLVTGSTTTMRTPTRPSPTTTVRIPPPSFVATRPTPPTFSAEKVTQRPQATVIPDEDVQNSASISHILHLLNDSSMAESIPEAGLVLISSSSTQTSSPTERPQPSLSTWVSVNKSPTNPSTTQAPSNQPSFIVTSNDIRPVTPRPTPSAPAPTVIVLGPFDSQNINPIPDVISRPPGSIQSVVAEEPSTPATPAFVAPTFDDAELTSKVHQFVDKIVNSLAGDFQNLEDVVLSNKNITLNAATTPAPSTTTKKPLRKPTTPTVKPVKKPTSSKPPVEAVVAETPRPTKKPAANTNKPPSANKPVKPATVTTTTTTTSRPADFRRECGVRPLVKSAKKNGRIVGGKIATFGEWPWQVLVRESTWLGLFTKNKCGGVLITSKYVVTAAHCQPGFLASLVAVFGEYDLSSELESRRAVVKNVKRVIIHRSYEPATFENDIALLELESAVPFEEHIVPICLPDDDEDFTGRMATVSGWGRLKYGGGVPSVLQEVQVPIMENNVCQDMFHASGHTKTIISSFLCAGYANGQKDSCEGDSGGPLMVERDGRWILAGTVSHGIKCAAPFLPGVYMRTTYYKPWLKTITGTS